MFPTPPKDNERRLALFFDRKISNSKLSSVFDQTMDRVLSEYDIAISATDSLYHLVDSIGVKPLSQKGKQLLYRYNFDETTLSSATNACFYALENEHTSSQFIGDRESLAHFDVDDSVGFSQYAPPQIIVDGCTLTLLNSRDDLFNESAEMQHAIRYFADKFEDGSWIGYGVKDSGGSRSSVAYSIEGTIPVVDTHKALANADPTDLHVRAVVGAIPVLQAALDKANDNNVSNSSKLMAPSPF